MAAKTERATLITSVVRSYRMVENMAIKWTNGYQKVDKRKSKKTLADIVAELRATGVKRLNGENFDVDDALTRTQESLADVDYDRNLSVEENLENRRRKLEEAWRKREKKAYLYRHGVYEK
jgi:hypothetical protein